MSGNYLEQRRRESRLHGFGLVLGLLLAVLFHVVLFWGPRVDYRPLLESARVRRVLVARPYEPKPPPKPAAPLPKTTVGAGAGSDTVSQTRGKIPLPDESAAARTESVQEAGGAEPFRRGGIGREWNEQDQPAARSESDREEVSLEPGPDAWSALMAELEQRGQSLEERMRREAEGTSDSVARGQGLQGAGEGKEGYLDPRIRVKVVSYPPTSIEGAFPPIPYPDLRFHQSQLTAGICRVYYRVWTDGSGRVVRDQIKSPATREERERYAPFVEAVTSEVAVWPFDRVKAEVHVDVLFEIE